MRRDLDNQGRTTAHGKRSQYRIGGIVGDVLGLTHLYNHIAQPQV